MKKDKQQPEKQPDTEGLFFSEPGEGKPVYFFEPGEDKPVIFPEPHTENSHTHKTTHK